MTDSGTADGPKRTRGALGGGRLVLGLLLVAATVSLYVRLTHTADVSPWLGRSRRWWVGQVDTVALGAVLLYAGDWLTARSRGPRLPWVRLPARGPRQPPRPDA